MQAKNVQSNTQAQRKGGWFNGIGTPTKIKKGDNLTVYDRKGNPLHLTAAELKGDGGEGAVYEIPGKPDVLVKIYKEESLLDPAKSKEIEKRINDMFAFSQAIEREVPTASLAWPRLIAYNARKQVVGFAMNKCKGVSFQALIGVRSIQQRFPKWSRRELVLVAKGFLNRLQYLVKKGIFVNDFNPANFYVDEQCNVSFIDCDSYQIPGENNSVDITTTYFASHVAPELLENQNLLYQPRNIHHVEFGGAMIVFNILMCGLHPYSFFDPSHQSDCAAPEENLLKGRCPLGSDADCRFPRGNWYNLWSYLPYNLKNSFIRTFRDGHKDPSKRATLTELQKNLEEFLRRMDKELILLDLNPEKPASRQTPKPKGNSSDDGRDKSGYKTQNPGYDMDDGVHSGKNQTKRKKKDKNASASDSPFTQMTMKSPKKRNKGGNANTSSCPEPLVVETPLEEQSGFKRFVEGTKRFFKQLFS